MHNNILYLLLLFSLSFISYHNLYHNRQLSPTGKMSYTSDDDEGFRFSIVWAGAVERRHGLSAHYPCIDNALRMHLKIVTGLITFERNIKGGQL